MIDTFGGIEAWPESTDAYAAAAETAMIASIERAVGKDEAKRELSCPRHQMLGMGKNIQGTAETARTQGDVLLLQVDSDLYLHEHFIFCDMGAAQFWIKPSDLAASRFDHAWATTEGVNRF